ncbi:ribonuclease H-like domain-containing protein [Tanacetum coccineum]
MSQMRMTKFYKKTGRKLQFDAKEPVGFDKTKVECYNCYKTRHFAKECRNKGTQDNRRRDAWNSGNKDGSRNGKKEESKALVTVDREGVDWTTIQKMMKYNGILSYENEVLQSVFKGKESDFENPPLNERIVKTGEMHAVPPPMTWNYMPSGPDIESECSYHEEYESDSEYEGWHRKAELNNGWNNVQRPFKKTTVLRTDFSKQKVNTAKVNTVSTVGGKGKLLLSPQQVVIGDHIRLHWNVDSGWFLALDWGNKAILAEFQDLNGGPIALAGKSGYINGLNQKVKTIRSDNGTEFKNKDVIEFCGLKGIKREYSNARTPQQNGVAERKNMTLIEAARTMLTDSFLPNTLGAEAV